MYQVGGWLGLVRPGWSRLEAKSARVPQAVIFLGATSLLTDISSEMVVSVLPIYLVGFLRMSPAQFGLLDGLYQGAAGLVQLGGAAFADFSRRHKEVAALGYGASLLSRVGLLATSGVAGLTTCLTIDRLGKGIRTAPRDALISLSAGQNDLGLAFGVHRAMDAVGAMIGPIAAFVILRSIVNGFDVVFVASLCAAVAGFATFLLLVENKPVSTERPDMRREFAAVLLSTPALLRLATAALCLGFLTISDGFIYLALQERTELSPSAFPLMYVLTAGCYLLCAIPVGRMADRLGRFVVFLAGHAVLAALYGVLLAGVAGPGLIALVVLLLGLYYAATEGVLMALGSALLPEGSRTSGLAVLTTTLALGRFAGSATFGIAWSRLGLNAAFILFLVGLAATVAVLAAAHVRRTRRVAA